MRARVRMKAIRLESTQCAGRLFSWTAQYAQMHDLQDEAGEGIHERGIHRKLRIAGGEKGDLRPSGNPSSHRHHLVGILSTLVFCNQVL